MTQLTQNDLRQHLAEQIQFLKRSCEVYDSGDHTESKRIAVHLRVLLHDTKNSKSLLGQLGLKTKQFLDTATEPPKNVNAITSYTGLIGTRIGAGEPSYVPNLDSANNRLIPFDQWWAAPIIIDEKQREISRGRLILYVCDKDGGAHVDPEMDDVYADLSKKNSLRRLRGSPESGWEPMPDAVHASLRQIAYEVLRVLDPSYLPTLKREPPHLVIYGVDLQIEPINKEGSQE